MRIEKMQEAYTLVRAYVIRHGGIAPYSEAVRVYGAAAVDGCVSSSEDMGIQTITVNDSTNQRPSHHLRCIIAKQWNGKQPPWLSHYYD